MREPCNSFWMATNLVASNIILKMKARSVNLKGPILLLDPTLIFRLRKTRMYRVYDSIPGPEHQVGEELTLNIGK
jgi:hypothetical protein